MTIYQKSSFSTAFVSDSLFHFDPVIVVGSPRSGTSVVTRLLQEELALQKTMLKNRLRKTLEKDIGNTGDNIADLYKLVTLLIDYVV